MGTALWLRFFFDFPPKQRDMEVTKIRATFWGSLYSFSWSFHDKDPGALEAKQVATILRKIGAWLVLPPGGLIEELHSAWKLLRFGAK